MNIGDIYIYNDIWDRILSYLEFKDLILVSKVNKLSYSLSQKYIYQRLNNIPWSIITHYHNGKVLSSRVLIGLYVDNKRKNYQKGKLIIRKGTGHPMINQIIKCYQTYDYHAIRINYIINRIWDYSVPVSVGIREGERCDEYDEVKLEVKTLDEVNVRMRRESFYAYNFD